MKGQYAHIKLSLVQILKQGYSTGCLVILIIPCRTKLLIGINVREVRNCQNREKFKPINTYVQQVIDAFRIQIRRS